MEFWKVIGALFRRLYIGPPIVALAIAAGALASHLTPLQYQSHAFVVLVTPSAGGTIERDPDKPSGRSNPLLQFNDSLRTTAAVLIQSMNTTDAFRELGVVRNGATTLVVDDGRSNSDLLGSNGPFIYIEGESSSAERARAVVTRADERLRAELERRQFALDAPFETFIRVSYVVAPTAAEPVISDKLQMGGLVLAGGIVLGMSIAYLLVRWRTAYTRRRDRQRAERKPSGKPKKLTAGGVRGEAKDLVHAGAPGKSR